VAPLTLWGNDNRQPFNKLKGFENLGHIGCEVKAAVSLVSPSKVTYSGEVLESDQSHLKG
jgi:hypothetical protein